MHPPPTLFSRRLALPALAMALGLALRFGLQLPPPPSHPRPFVTCLQPPPPLPPPPPGELRIAVVRLQEIVDHYDRYIYVTARLTEDFKAQYRAAQQAVDDSEREAVNASFDLNDNWAVLLDDAKFTQALQQGNDTSNRRIDASLRLRRLDTLKADLNTEMSLATMEDIETVIHEVAAEAGYDAVTDYVSTLAAPTEYDAPGVWFENLKRRAPVLYAAPPHDLTTEVLTRLNARYHATYGAGDRSDPLLTADFATLAHRLASRLERFRQRNAAPALTHPMKPTHHPGLRVAVINLERVIDQLREKTGFNQARAQLQRQVDDLQAEAHVRQSIYDDRSSALTQAISQGQRIAPSETRQLLQAFQASQMAQYQAFYGRTLWAAWQGREDTKIATAIQREIARQAAAQHIDLVFATFGPNPLPDPRDLSPNGQVPWHRTAPGLDLTATVLDRLTHPKTTRPLPATDPPDIDTPDLFNLSFDGPTLFRQTCDQWQTHLDRQRATDAARFAAWHRYQQEVLQQTPPAAPATNTAP